MLKKSILFKNFQKSFSINNDKKKILKIFNKILSEKNEIIKSLSHDYKNSFKKKQLSIIKKKFFNLRIIGMGGSILGAQAIYDFLKTQNKKKFYFR